MNANVKREPQSMAVRLTLTAIGALLMVGPPYAFAVSGLSGRLDRTVVVAIELVLLAIGFVLLYLSLKRQESPN
jgi:hypothetical protein